MVLPTNESALSVNNTDMVTPQSAITDVHVYSLYGCVQLCQAGHHCKTVQCLKKEESNPNCIGSNIQMQCTMLKPPLECLLCTR